MPQPSLRSQLIEGLKQQLGSARPGGARERVSTGIAPLDELLPSRGVHRGTLIEWLADVEGSGAGTLALLAGSRMVRPGDDLILVDQHGEFYPPAAITLGLNLDRMVIVRPSNSADMLWALEQTLRCPGVTLVLCWLDQEHNRGLRRLQLAAEAGNTIGFLIRPARVQSLPSWAEIRFLVRSRPSQSPGWRLQVELIRCRSGLGGGTVDLEIAHDGTDLVRLAPPLVGATDSRRAAGA